MNNVLCNIEKEIIQIRRQIHKNPEVSGKEINTRKIILDFLNTLPLDIKLSKTSMSVVAILKGNKQGKTIAFRADMDALPLKEETKLSFKSVNDGVCHSCGHDIHTAALLGCAKILSHYVQELNGNVVFIFQSAEETLSGARNILDENLLDKFNISKIFALHTWPDLPAGNIGIKKGAAMASSDNVDIEISGQSGHGAHPHRSIDAIVIASQIISSLQTILSREIPPIESAVISFGKITGGQARNIIADKVLLEGTVRTLNPDIRKQIPQMIERITKNIAQAMKGNVSVRYDFGTPVVLNNDKAVDIVINSAEKVIDKDKISYLPNPSMGSEDFAFYMEKYPGCLFRIGTANEEAESKLALHNPKIIFDEKAIIIGTKVLTQIALTVLK